MILGLGSMVRNDVMQVSDVIIWERLRLFNNKSSYLCRFPGSNSHGYCGKIKGLFLSIIQKNFSLR